MSSLLTQNDACGFGAIDATMIAAAATFQIGRAADAASHVANITATTRNAHIMNRTGRISSMRGRRWKMAQGIANPSTPAMCRFGPRAATTIARNKIVRNLPAGVGQNRRRNISTNTINTTPR